MRDAQLMLGRVKKTIRGSNPCQLEVGLRVCAWKKREGGETIRLKSWAVFRENSHPKWNFGIRYDYGRIIQQVSVGYDYSIFSPRLNLSKKTRFRTGS